MGLLEISIGDKTNAYNKLRDREYERSGAI